jgi:biopolymer transport protein ExbD
MAFKPSASKRHGNSSDGELNMNSMMDMVTIILLFLLKTYSTEGALKANADDLKLPSSYRLEKPVKAATVTVSQSVIMLGDRVVLTRAELDPDQRLIPPLANLLREKAEKEKEVEAYGGEFTHEVLLIIDKDVPFDLLTKVIYSCGKSEYDKIRLMVQSTQGTEEF